MFKRLLIANRGEIAVRIIRSCRDLGITSVLVYSEEDADSLAVALADESICIGPALAKESYLNIEAVLAAAEVKKVEAIHPGYGFLAENEVFARRVVEAGYAFIGPSSSCILMMGDKIKAREKMIEAKVPVTPGSGEIHSFEELEEFVQTFDLPVLLKASAGGGGKGMRLVEDINQLYQAFEQAKTEARNAFGNDTIFVEKYIREAKHVEVQILADRYGHVIHLGERDCSMQRQNQKLIEESPCHILSDDLRNLICQTAIRVAQSVDYEGAGTVEFLLDKQGQFYFMEMNTRIQVEHPVTEMVTGMDLVREQIRIASGLPLSVSQEEVTFSGHAIECRINAEKVKEHFRPSSGQIDFCYFPQGPNVRVDTGVTTGSVISPYYDGMIAKVITVGDTRLEALKRMRRALTEVVIEGVDTTSELAYLLLYQMEFVRGTYQTCYLEQHLEELIDFV